MLISDTTYTKDTSVVVKDSVFIPQYLEKNPLDIYSKEKCNVSIKQCIFSCIKDSEIKQKHRQSIFTEKTFYHKDLALQPNNNVVNNDWIFGILFFIILLSALFLHFVGSLMLSFIVGCFSKNHISIITKEGTTLHILSFLTVMFVFLPLVSFIVYSGFNYFEMRPYIEQTIQGTDTIVQKPIVFWICIYICSILAYLLRILLIQFFSWVFKAKKISNYYVQTILNFGNLAGFCLILPTFFVIYSSSYYEEFFLYIALLILVVLYVIRLFRCFYIIINIFKFSHVYLFFYLCILELLPLIIIVKLLFF